MINSLIDSNVFIIIVIAITYRYPDIVMTITFGDFGEADPEVVEASGHSKYNVEVQITSSS